MKKSDCIFICIGCIIILILGITLGMTFNNNEFSENTKVSDTSKNGETKNDVIEEKENSNKDDNKSNKIEEDKKISSNESNKNDNIHSNKNSKNENKTNEDNVVTYSNKDQLVINSLSDTLTKVNNTKSKDNNSLKGVFVSIVDFIFYDGSINGVTFKELTDSGKKKVLEIASKIDKAIDSKIPGYKESIANGTSKVFNKASELIKKGANNFNSFLESKLDNEDYNSLIQAKDELVKYSKNALNFIGDVGSSLFNNTKDKLDSWYNSWKDK